MKRTGKALLATAAALTLGCALALGGCTGSTAAYITSIAKTGTNGAEDIYTITYSDGSTDTFTVTNGTDGEDGKDVTIHEIYEAYKAKTGDESLTFSDFLADYLTLNTDMSSAISTSLQSVAKIYAEFVETTTTGGIGGWRPGGTTTTTSSIAMSTGAAVIYSMDTAADGYTYFVTNYHVVYDNNADASRNNDEGTKTARSIHAYLYGSEGYPSTVDENGDGIADTKDGYTVYDYGDYAIALDYVGGSIEYDIAVLRTKTSEVLAVNENAKAVRLAESYHVGETAIAIGNPEGDGLSVTQGIVSTESEYITLSIDSTSRSYRSIRIDTALYSGNSGGGLFNKYGELIGITNAGDSTDQNINYAVPLEIVCGTVDGIIYYSNDGNEATDGVYRLLFGVTVSTQNSKYVYDAASGYGNISEEVVVASVSAGSAAEAMGVQTGDIILSVTVNGETYTIDRSFDIENLSFNIRANDIVSMTLNRSGETVTTNTYSVSLSSLTSVA